MYGVSLFNDSIETVIHYPSAEKDTPHLLSMRLKLTENQASTFTFIIYKNQQGYDLLVDLVTKVEILELIDNTSKFDGRVLVSSEGMDSSGKFYKEVTCESELAYFNDSRVGRWELHPSTLPEDSPAYAEPNHNITTALQKIINNHNANVGLDKQFTLGTIQISDGVYFATSYESSLDILISKIVNDRNAVLKIRKVNGVRYLDILIDNAPVSATTITLSKNLKDFKKTPDYSSFCTRLLAIGADGITFESINNGKQYVENADAIARVGIITKPFEWKDVTIKENLLQKAQVKLTEILNEDYISVTVTAFDLYCIGVTPEAFDISTKYLTENIIQNFSKVLKVIQIDLDLLQPWNSSLVFSNKPVTATASSVGIQQQVNTNRVEVLTYNGRIIQKVSSADGRFESYKEQTDKAITERVTNDDFESYQLQTAKEISAKVSNEAYNTYKIQTATLIGQQVSDSEFSSKFDQDAKSFNFTLGDGTTVVISKDSLRVSHTGTGNYTEMNSSGTKRYIASTGRTYHSMMYTGSVSNVESLSTVRIQIPSEFIGTDYKVDWWSGNVFPENPTDLLYSVNAAKTAENKLEGWFEVRAELMVRDPATEGAPNWRGKINVLYTVIA